MTWNYLIINDTKIEMLSVVPKSASAVVSGFSVHISEQIHLM